jgi:hypothetical protein
MRNSWRWGLALMLAALAGCGSADDAAQADGTSGASGTRKSLSPETARLTANMVSAVSAGTGTAPVEVKFEFGGRPEAGKPLEVSLVLIPTTPLERLYARFQPGEGLELVKGEETEQFTRPVSGAPIAHTLTVIPQRDGIFTLHAVVLTDSQTDSVTRNFSIPLIAGSGLPELAPKSAEARSTAYAQPAQNTADR